MEWDEIGERYLTDRQMDGRDRQTSSIFFKKSKNIANKEIGMSAVLDTIKTNKVEKQNTRDVIFSVTKIYRGQYTLCHAKLIR